MHRYLFVTTIAPRRAAAATAAAAAAPPFPPPRAAARGASALPSTIVRSRVREAPPASLPGRAFAEGAPWRPPLPPDEEGPGRDCWRRAELPWADGAPPPGGRRRHRRHQGEGEAVLFPAPPPHQDHRMVGGNDLLDRGVEGAEVPPCSLRCAARASQLPAPLRPA